MGDHVILDIGVYITTQANIGDYVHIAPYCIVSGGKNSSLIMKEFSGMAARTTVLAGSDDFTNSMMNPQIPIKYRAPKLTTITFEKFSCTGVHCVVMPGVTLGEGSVVGANSVVTKNTEPWTVYTGTPARPVKTRNKRLILKYARELGYEFP